MGHMRVISRVFLACCLTLSIADLGSAAGTATSGGGGAMDERSITPDEIKHLIIQNQRSAWEVFAALEASYLSFRFYADHDPRHPLNFVNFSMEGDQTMTWPTDGKAFLKIGKRLFDSNPPSDIFNLKIKLEFREPQACIDPVTQEEVDAAAIAPDTICFSLSRLAKKLSVDNAQRQIIALLVHEMAHLMGANQNECVFLQQAALQAAHLGLLDDTIVDMRTDGTKVRRSTLLGDNLWDLTHALQEVEKQIDAGQDFTQICNSIQSKVIYGGSVHMAPLAFRTQLFTGRAPARGVTLQVLNALYHKARALELACLNSSENPVKSLIKTKLYAGRPQMPLKDYKLSEVLPPDARIELMMLGDRAVSKTEIIRYVEAGDLATLKQEITDLRRLIRTAQYHLWNSFTEGYNPSWTPAE